MNFVPAEPPRAREAGAAMSGADDLAQPLRKLRPTGSRDLAGTTQQGGHRSPGSILLQVPGQQSRPQTWKPWVLEAWRAPWWPPEASAQRAHRLLRPRPLGPQAFVSMSSPLVWTEVAPRSLLGSGHGDAHGRTPPSTSFLDTPACECAAQGVGSGIDQILVNHLRLFLLTVPFIWKENDVCLNSVLTFIEFPLGLMYE